MITIKKCTNACNGNKKAGSILYGWLENEDALYDDEEDVFSSSNLEELVDACDDKEKQKIVANAIGIELFEDEN